MTQKEFIDVLDINEEGHYPFYCFVKTGKGETHLVAMALVYIQEVYNTINMYLKSGASFLHFSADFPKSKAMPTDYVAIHTYENERWSCVLLPYDEKGHRLKLVESGVQQELLLEQVISECSVIPSFV